MVGFATVLGCDLVGVCSLLNPGPAVFLMVLGKVGKWSNGRSRGQTWGTLLGFLLPPAWRPAGLAEGKVSREGSGFRSQQAPRIPSSGGLAVMPQGEAANVQGEGAGLGWGGLGRGLP